MKKKKNRFSNIPKTSDPVLRMIRNFTSIEYDGSLVYPKGPTFKEWIVAGVLYWILNNGTAEQYKEISDIYDDKIKEGGAFPFACTLHSYCEKHDSVWYNNHQKIYK